MGKVKFDPDAEIPALAGRVILVTGGNEGIGKETVLQLSKHQPSKIFLSARSQEKADKAIAEIKQKAGANVAPIEFIPLDLSSFDSIKQAVADLKSRTDRLDILISNAGVIGQTGVTKEGYEWAFGVNHVGASLLIRLLYPLLKETAARPDTSKNATRVVILASEAEKLAPKEYAFADIKTDLKNMATFAKYGQSKLANAHFAWKMAEHYPEENTGVKIVAVHPGAVQSNLGNNMLSSLPSFLRVGLRKTINVAMRLVPVSEGAWNSLWAATNTSESKLGEPKEGVLYWPVALTGKATEKAYNEKLADQLWEWTEKELSPHLQ